MTALRSVLVTLALCIGVSWSQAAAITQVKQSLASLVADGTTNQKVKLVEDWPLSIPALPDPFQIEGLDGNAYARGATQWSAVGGQLIASIDAKLFRTGAVNSVAEIGYELEFTVHEDTAYEMSGFLSVTDVDPTESAGVVLTASLGYGGPGIYFEQQLSTSTHNEYFTLSGRGGDRGNLLQPGSSLTGTLEAGRRYSLRSAYTVSNVAVFFPGGPDAGASAVGGFTFKIGNVPEPSSLAMLPAMGLVGLIRRTRCGSVRAIS